MFSSRHQILLSAARKVISNTKMILGDEARTSRMVIVGGLAVMRLTNEYRTTTDLDFFVGGKLMPSKLKRQLPRVCRDFTTSLEAINGVTYRSPIMKSIVPIDFIDTVVTEFEPQVKALDQLGADELPWATRDDVISMKAFGASKRDEPSKRLRDIADIQHILRMHPGPLLFSGSAVAWENKTFVKGFLPLLVENSEWSEKEWLERLGL